MVEQPPVIDDLLKGYGDPSSVGRTVRSITVTLTGEPVPHILVNRKL